MALRDPLDDGWKIRVRSRLAPENPNGYTRAGLARKLKVSKVAITHLLATKEECERSGQPYRSHSKLARPVAQLVGEPLPTATTHADIAETTSALEMLYKADPAGAASFVATLRDQVRERLEYVKKMTPVQDAPTPQDEAHGATADKGKRARTRR